MTWGVGIIGSGPGVAALHAPTLARVSEDFRLVHVSDAGSGRAAVIADRFGARASTGVEGLLADGEVDVVAICSPPARHAEHVRAAWLRAAARSSSRSPWPTPPTTPPVWSRSAPRWGRCSSSGRTTSSIRPGPRRPHHLHAIDGRISSVTVTLCLSPNDRYHALTMGEPLPAGTATPRPPLDLDDPERSAAIVRQLIAGLGVHDLPLVRDLVPATPELVWARPVPPIGFDLALRADGASCDSRP